MIESTILPSKLQSFEYYVNKLPLYLQQSYGFIEHFRIWYDVLVGQISKEENSSGVLGFSNAIFNLLNIFNQTSDDAGNITNHYLEDLIKFEDADVTEKDKYGTKSDVLDKLGKLFGVKRAFEVQYEKDGAQIKKLLKLNNEEFLMLIKAQIIKNYCNGSFSQLKEYYENIGLYVYITTSTELATSNVYLVYFTEDTVYTPSENVQDMFFAGLLTIQSMGIRYRHAFVDFDNILVWDTYQEDRQNGWGDLDGTYGGQWVV